MQIINNIALISINETLLVQLISFLIFLFIINRIMFRPLRRVMIERENHVEKINLDIIDAGESLYSVTDQIKQKKTAVRSEAFEVSEKIREQGMQKSAEMLSAVRAEINNLQSKARTEAEAQLTEARKKLDNESEVLSISIMEKVLERRLVL
ncbi:MAG: hypothetical protein JRE58_11420 [Deltaproteobacteria bacterium]|nr:hypothetical protein [Deltaproteobacteria bacterium]